MNYLSVCSGIEAATVAWKPLGWKAQAFSEIDPFPCSVLAYHYPEIKNLGDIRNVTKENISELGATGLLVGGTPCQDFSVAGARAGMDGERSSLVREYIRILRELTPRWFIWENVPGVLSSSGGRDFRAILREFEACGYGCCWRILDVQYVRVDGYVRAIPQRRERVFVVGYFGDWRPSATVLFESASMCGNTPPSREAGKGIARDVSPSINASGRGISRAGESRGQDCVIPVESSASVRSQHNQACDGVGIVVESQYGEIAGTINARNDSSPCADRGQNVIAQQVQWTSGGGQLLNDTAQAIRSVESLLK